MEARRSGTSRSDLIEMSENVDELLDSHGVKISYTPRYKPELQIDEIAFQSSLEEKVSYSNPNAQQCDINSVRSIYVLRSGNSPANLEYAKAILVTSNSGFAQAAYEYGKNHEESREVSSVITDFSLANAAWLKAPLSSPSLPMSEVIAFSYGALQPTNNFWDKYLFQIEKLEKRGKITAEDHQLLRSSEYAHFELMSLTLGEEKALTEETVTESLSRIKNEIRHEESKNFKREMDAHRQTKKELKLEQDKSQKIQSKVYRSCHVKARIVSWFCTLTLSFLIVLGAFSGIELYGNSPILGSLIVVGTVVAIFVGVAGSFWGFSVKSFHEFVFKKSLTFFLKRDFHRLGLDVKDGFLE